MNELSFQTHVCNSYLKFGGNAEKWATEWAKGRPDIIATLPFYGLHLIEIKVMTDLESKGVVANPMTKKQRSAAREWTNAGGLVFLGVIIGSKAVGSRLGYYSHDVDEITYTSHFFEPYVPKTGYNVKQLVGRMID